MEVKVKKGIEGFLTSYQPSNVESEKVLATTEPRFKSLFAKFQQLRKQGLAYFPMGTVDDILTPKELNLFVKQSVAYDTEYDDWKTSYNFVAGHFFTKLVQNSYDAGNNNFILEFPSLIDRFGEHLDGSARGRLKVMILGQLTDIGCGPHRVWFEIDRRIRGICNYSSFSSYKVHGDCDIIGSNHYNSFFEVGEVLDISIGNAKCTLKTDSEKTKKLLNEHPGIKLVDSK